MDRLVVVQRVPDDLHAVLPDDYLVHVGSVASEVPGELHDLGGGLDAVLGLDEPHAGGLPEDFQNLLGGGLRGELRDDGVDVHEGGGRLDGHGVDVKPWHDALDVGPVVGGEAHGRLQSVYRAVLAVPGVGRAPDDGHIGVLDLEFLVNGVQGPQEPGGVAGHHAGKLGAPGFGVVGGGVERDPGEAVVLPSLEYRLDAGGLVLVPVHLPHVAGGAVHHDVHLGVHVLEGPGDLDAGVGEGLHALVRDVYVVAFPNGGERFEVRPGLGDSDELHVVLRGHRGRDPFADGSVSVDSNPDFRHFHNLAPLMRRY